MREAIILFTRVPVPGKTKTRLMPDFSKEDSCKIHTILLENIFNCIKSTKRDIFIYIYPIEKVDLMESILKFEKFYGQKGKNLNEKIANSIYETLEKGYDKVILVGSDIVGIDKSYMDKAFNMLDTKDIVIGPVKDGGYGLIGMKKRHEIFNEEKSGHSEVLKNLIQRIVETRLTYGLLEEILDVDDIGDFNLITGNKNKNICEFERIIKYGQ
ncbi:MAG: TIGR04282 family arsenosugar biosynthesis glycosyltransferase [Lagierella massiliensis]|nr:TIGR04282 family arsenosugar biosynthesis glycosyltransferase [Lagierella massiliensis]